MTRNGGPKLLLLCTLLARFSLGLAARQEFDHDLVEWLVAKGGYFNHKQEIRPEITKDQTSRLVGIFAAERIAEGEILSYIPWDIIIEGEEDEEDEESRISCHTVRNLAREMKLGEESKYAPYISHLLAQKKGQLPSSWSQAGKDLFMEVLGGDNPAILSAEAVELLEYDWFELCGGKEDDELSANAAMLVKQHADDGLMIPISNLYTHRNGPWYNTKTEVTEEVSYTFLARRTIEVGEQIHDSVYDCDDCDEYSEYYGTPGKFNTT
jgi:hypothetical protein